MLYSRIGIHNIRTQHQIHGMNRQLRSGMPEFTYRMIDPVSKRSKIMAAHGSGFDFSEIEMPYYSPLSRKYSVGQYSIEDLIEPKKLFAGNDDLISRIVNDFRGFLGTDVYTPEKAGKLFSLDDVLKHTINSFNLIVIRKDSSIKGFASSNFVGKADSQDYFIEFASTMMSRDIRSQAGIREKQKDPFLLHINFRLLNNALHRYWAGQETDLPTPTIVSKTQNPVVIRYCKRFFSTFDPLLGSTRNILEIENMRNLLSRSFGVEINSDWIVKQAYPARMWTQDMGGSINRITENSLKRGREVPLEIEIVRNMLKRRDSYFFAGDFLASSYLELAGLPEFSSETINEVYEKVKFLN